MGAEWRVGVRRSRRDRRGAGDTLVVGRERAVLELTGAMAEAAVAFVQSAWPVQVEGDPPRRGWDHMFSTSYQIACMALVALGEAEDAVWGAVPKADPRLPEVLPFWEDIAVAVLWLARQQSLLIYRQMDGSLPAPHGGGFAVQRIGGPPLPPPNILAGPGSGPARAAEVVIPALEVMGLLRDGRWTPEAETVLWRGMPATWSLRFDTDLRLLAAVEAAVTTVPKPVREEIDRMMRISAADVAAVVAQSERAHEDLAIRFGRPSRTPPYTTEQARRSLLFRRENDLDWVIFRKWRLGRGWLDAAGQARTLEIFHDGLAITMRKQVVARLYPGGFTWE